MQMQDPAFVWVAVCGLSLVCLGTIVVVGLLVLRFTGRTIGEMIGNSGGLGGVMGAIGAAAADAGDDGVDSGVRRERRNTASASRDLRAQAKSLDFNEAVNRYRTGQQPPASQQAARPAAPRPTPSGTPPAQPTSPFAPPPEPRESGKSLRARESKRRNTDQEADDLLGGFLDDDGGDIF